MLTLFRIKGYLCEYVFGVYCYSQEQQSRQKAQDKMPLSTVWLATQTHKQKPVNIIIFTDKDTKIIDSTCSLVNAFFLYIFLLTTINRSPASSRKLAKRYSYQIEIIHSQTKSVYKNVKL